MGTYKKIKENLLIRVDSNKEIGLGHILRVIRIFKNTKKNLHINFIVDHLNNNLIKIENLGNYTFRELYNKKEKFISQQHDAKKFINYIKKFNNPIVIVDDYRLDEKWQKKVKKYTKKLIVIDDLCNRKIYADVYINYKTDINNNLLNKAKKLNKRGTELLVGNKYCILGKNLNKNLNKKKIIMLNFGNSFNFYTIKKLIYNLIRHKIKFYVCIGMLSKNYEYIINLKKKYKNIKIIYKKLFIDKYLSKVSMFIGTKGNAIYEMSYLNTPSIFFTNSENQINNNSDMEKLGHYFFVNKKDLNTNKILILIDLLYKNYKEVKNLHKNKNISINKFGYKKIIREIFK